MHCSLSRISFPFCAMLPIAKVGACYRLTPTWYFQFSLRDYSDSTHTSLHRLHHSTTFHIRLEGWW